MRFPVTDKALRRLVVQLAAAAPEDVELVLESLEAGQAQRVRALLSDYAPETWPRAAVAEASPRAQEPGPEPEPEDDRSYLAGLSPWLSDRADGEAPQGVRMTGAALMAVNAAARALPVDPTFAFGAARPEPRPLNPFRRLLRRGGA